MRRPTHLIESFAVAHSTKSRTLSSHHIVDALFSYFEPFTHLQRKPPYTLPVKQLHCIEVGGHGHQTTLLGESQNAGREIDWRKQRKGERGRVS